MNLSAVNDVYADFSGLAQLRASAARDGTAVLPDVAKQFEALFLQMMLKSMREATPGDPLLSGEGARMYRDLFDHQISLELARGKGIGITDMLVRQLAPAAEPLGVGAGDAPGAAEQGTAAADRASPAQRGLPTQAVSNAPTFESPDAFARRLWPHALEAAQTLGVAPRLLIAQAALETGWGQSIIRYPDGRSSHNLFGIKSDPGWDGPRTRVWTLEHADGVMERRSASFRAYESFKQSFDDYVDFVSTQGRYRRALAVAGDPGAYAQSLQDAGYATDPHYAEKIMGVMHSKTLRSLKFPPDDPLQGTMADKRSR